MLARVDENTICVVPTLGVTYTGEYEPVSRLSDALDGLQRETGLDIDIHVDGASGAFLAPFCAPDLEWDFRLPRVKSISTSGHKFGLAPLGVGWVVWRDTDDLPDDLIFHVSYLGGDMPVFQINFSRPAGQVAAQYYDFLRLGREGYRRVHTASYATAAYARRGDPRHSARSSWCAPATPRARSRVSPGGSGRRRTRLHAVRPRGPAPGPRLAGTGVPADRLESPTSSVQRILVRQDVSRDLAVDPAATTWRTRYRPLRPASGAGADDGHGGERLQPSVSGGTRHPRAGQPDRRRGSKGISRSRTRPMCEDGRSGR